MKGKSLSTVQLLHSRRALLYNHYRTHKTIALAACHVKMKYAYTRSMVGRPIQNCFGLNWRRLDKGIETFQSNIKSVKVSKYNKKYKKIISM